MNINHTSRNDYATFNQYARNAGTKNADTKFASKFSREADISAARESRAIKEDTVEISHKENTLPNRRDYADFNPYARGMDARFARAGISAASEDASSELNESERSVQGEKAVYDAQSIKNGTGQIDWASLYKSLNLFNSEGVITPEGLFLKQSILSLKEEMEIEKGTEIDETEFVHFVCESIRDGLMTTQDLIASVKMPPPVVDLVDINPKRPAPSQPYPESEPQAPGFKSVVGSGNYFNTKEEVEEERQEFARKLWEELSFPTKEKLDKIEASPARLLWEELWASKIETDNYPSPLSEPR